MTDFQDSEARGFDDQGFDDQGFDDQGFDNQGFDNQGFDNQGFDNQGFDNWAGDLSPAELQLQADLSCLVDDELDEAAAARVMVQMKESPACQAFFEDARRYVRLHRDITDPERLVARLATLSGLPDVGAIRAEAEQTDLLHRLATIFYQLGKAFVLAGVDLRSFRERVFEAAVPVDRTRTEGRGFVDGVLRNTDGGGTAAGWNVARAMLDGRLEQLHEPLEQGRRLLLQALETDPGHDEAKIYLAFLHAHEGRTLRAADQYREVFDTSMSLENRGHAANQLGRLYRDECEWRRALACWRWITMSGLADRDSRFWMVRFNIGVVYANLRDRERALDYFRRLIDAHPDHVSDVAEAFANTPALQNVIQSQPGFPEALLARCPELFEAPPHSEG